MIDTGSLHKSSKNLRCNTGGNQTKPGFFQEIRSHTGPNDVEAIAKVNLDVLSESTGVVIPGRLGVTNCLHNR